MNQKGRFLFNHVPHLRDLKHLSEAQGEYPVGHYYSPVPAKHDVKRYVEARKPLPSEIPGIQLNKDGQRALLEEYASLYATLGFPKNPTPEYRYHYENNWFSYSDAIFLSCFLRKHLPRRIVEVGSGFSSAVILDTVDRFFPVRPDITFIEPHSDRLLSLFKDGDRQTVQLIDRELQDVSLDHFSSLQSGDLLFIDSSHVFKCGSDLHWLFFEIVPLLQPGVYVHFHDVFYPFDYPSEWLLQGRYWNENYFLRAFLSWSSEWHIRFFNTYVHIVFSEFITQHMPLCRENVGGSLYIQRAVSVDEANSTTRSGGLSL